MRKGRSRANVISIPFLFAPTLYFLHTSGQLQVHRGKLPCLPPGSYCAERSPVPETHFSVWTGNCRCWDTLWDVTGRSVTNLTSTFFFFFKYPHKFPCAEWVKYLQHWFCHTWQSNAAFIDFFLFLWLRRIVRSSANLLHSITGCSSLQFFSKLSQYSLSSV